MQKAPIALTPLFEAALDGPVPRECVIPVENTNGPILLISGDEDRMWPSARMGDQIVERLEAHRHRFHVRHCRYPGAGHYMRTPGVPTSVLQGAFELGGDGAAQAAANRSAWAETLTFLETSLCARSDAAEACGDWGHAMMATALRALALGLVSTLSMDLLTGVAIGLKLIAPLPPHLVGRWFASVARAQPLHADIARASPVSHELLIALPVHYAIGITLTTLFVWATGQMGWSRTPATALAFGLFTCALPWLLMFPAMGYGLFGSNGPEGTRLFLSSLVTHAFFGLGLWIAAHTMTVP